MCGTTKNELINELENLKSGTASVKVLKSDAKWFGVTYKKDKEIVQKEIEALRKQKVYPFKLWKNDN